MGNVGSIHWRTVWPAVLISLALVLLVLLVTGQLTRK